MSLGTCLDMGKHALLIIDMQNDLCHDIRRSAKVEVMLVPMLRMVDAFANNGNLVVYTKFELPEDDEQFSRFGDRYCIEGTPGAEFISEILPLRGPVVIKRKHSAFFETELDDLLRKHDVNELYLCGLQTHICIMTTAADASFRGYRTVAISDCVVSSNEKNRIQALEWIARYVGEVRQSNEIIQNG